MLRSSQKIVQVLLYCPACCLAWCLCLPYVPLHKCSTAYRARVPSTSATTDMVIRELPFFSHLSLAVQSYIGCPTATRRLFRFWLSADGLVCGCLMKSNFGMLDIRGTACPGVSLLTFENVPSLISPTSLLTPQKYVYSSRASCVVAAPFL